MKTLYMITGDLNEVATVMEPMQADLRFLSDKKNVSEYKWYPLTKDTHVVEAQMLSDVDTDELCILTAELTSLTIGRLRDGILYDVIADGTVEVVDDSTITPR